MFSWGFKILAACCLLSSGTAMATVSSPSASSDAANLYYQFTYSGTPKFYRAFLDTDKNSATGYRAYGVGADYLLENGNLYKYAGSNGGWGWSKVRTVTMTNSNFVVRWAIAKTDIGSPSALNYVFQHDNPVATSAVMSQSISAVVSNSISLSVAGAPNLPYNGTSTLVTIGFVGSAPAKIALARDGLPVFATWPGGTFFTLAADGKSISGNWCISASCWGYQSGAHYLTAVATYADGSSKSSTVSINVVTSSPSPTPSPSPTSSPTPIATPSPTPVATPTPTPTPVSSGPTYYVSPSGNDLSAGSSSAPWRTIQKAADSVSAGATIVLMDGTYEEGQISFKRSGTASAPITVRAQNKWMAVLSSISGCNPGISLYASYITLQDFRLSVSPRNANCTIYTAANVHVRAWNMREPTPSDLSTGYEGFAMRGMKIDGGTIRAEGVKSNQNYTIMENNESYNSMELFNNKDSIIRNNVFFGQGYSGISIFAKGGLRNAKIYNNIIHQKAANGNGIIIGGFSCDTCHFDQTTAIEAYNTVAYNNVVINESGGQISALAFWGAKDSTYFNNVVINGVMSMTLGGHNSGPQAPTTNPTFKNNIFVCSGGGVTSSYFGFSYSGTLNVDYNNFYKCTGAPAQAHSIVGNPMFVNQLSDWHLQAGSPAINSGLAVTMPAYGGGTIDISQDYNGVLRSSPWDLGIYNIAP